MWGLSPCRFRWVPTAVDTCRGAQIEKTERYLLKYEPYWVVSSVSDVDPIIRSAKSFRFFSLRHLINSMILVSITFSHKMRFFLVSYDYLFAECLSKVINCLNRVNQEWPLVPDRFQFLREAETICELKVSLLTPRKHFAPSRLIIHSVIRLYNLSESAESHNPLLRLVSRSKW